MTYWNEEVEPSGPTVAAITFLWTLLVGLGTYVGLIL